jgi:dolichol-phosphate mannosyltransferase
MKVAVVVAAYDEQESISDLTRRLDRALRGVAGTDFELIFVVEGDDDTREILEGLAAELGRIRILYEPGRAGLGNAFRRGFAAVRADVDFVVTLDADLNHAPEEIPVLLEELVRRRLDVLVGSRFVGGSRTVGVPVWKAGLSSIMNRIIAGLFDVPIRDKTSGFRVYQAEALRLLLGYRNKDFAFLPEMLIRASELGLSIGESPIHFIYRTRGRSKMDIPQTIGSYFTLLRSRFDSASIAALSVILAGVVARLLYAFPLHKYVPDADSVLSALRALDIQHGRLRVFYSYTRLGALESYMHAAAFILFGVSRFALTLAPLFSGIAGMFVFFFFVRELFGRRAAVFALIFFSLPSPAYLAWTYMPNGYPETMLLCLLILYFAARIVRRGWTPWTALALGLSAGLGLWNSFETMMCAGPAFAWLFLSRGREIRARKREIVLLGAAFLIGLSPWILYNVRYPMASLRHDLGGRPARGVATMAANAWYFLGVNVPRLAVGANPFQFADPPSEVARILRWPAAALYVIAMIAFLPAFWKRPRQDDPPLARSGALLLWMVGLVAFGLNVVSAAGETRGLTERYVLPVFFLCVTALGALTHAAWKRSRSIAIGVMAVVLVFNAAGYFLPWTIERRYFRDLLDEDRKVTAYLENQSVRWICGNYWIVYPVNFSSRERILAIPFEADNDHYGYAGRLPVQPVRWAVVARDVVWLRRWMTLAGVRGRIFRVGAGYHVFRPDAAEEEGRSPRKTLRLLQQTASWGH